MGLCQLSDGNHVSELIIMIAILIICLRSEECSYHHIEPLLCVEWREYLKNLILYPTKVSKKQYDHFCSGLRHDEKVNN